MTTMTKDEEATLLAEVKVAEVGVDAAVAAWHASTRADESATYRRAKQWLAYRDVLKVYVRDALQGRPYALDNAKAKIKKRPK